MGQQYPGGGGVVGPVDATAQANLGSAVTLTPGLAEAMLGILHGKDAGEAAFTMAKASLDVGLRDIESYMTSGTHYEFAYTSRILNWYKMDIDWNQYGREGEDPEVIMERFLKEYVRNNTGKK